MPGIELFERNQKAVLWPAVDTDDYGETRVGDPVELDVRWEWGEKQLLSADGQLIAAAATVVVDRDVEVGSCMWEGTLADWLSTGVNTVDNELQVVVGFTRIPDLKDRHTRRLVFTKRYKDSLPPTA